MQDQLHADLLQKSVLAVLVLCTLEVGKELLDLTVILLEDLDPPALFCGVGEGAEGMGFATVGFGSLPDTPMVVLLDVLVVLVAIAVSVWAVSVRAMRALGVRCSLEPHCLKSNSGLKWHCGG
jgi:hypothetical protein